MLCELRLHACGTKIRVIGEKASLEWWDEHPNQLTLEVQGEPVRILERGMGYLEPSALGRPHRGRGILRGCLRHGVICTAVSRARWMPQTGGSRRVLVSRYSCRRRGRPLGGRLRAFRGQWRRLGGLSITSWRRFKELSKRGRCHAGFFLNARMKWEVLAKPQAAAIVSMDSRVSASIILACFKRSPRRY